MNAEIIQQNWPLTQVKMNGILQRSGERIVGRLNSKQGEFVYKIADPWKTAQTLEKDLSIFAFLIHKNFKHLPKLIKTKHSKNFICVENKFVYLLEYVEGQNPEPSPQTYKQLGEITALLHNTKGYPHETDFKPQDIIPDLLNNAKNYSFGEEYIVLLKSLPNFKQFPTTLIHTDIAPTNSIQKSDGTIVLVDWDDTGIGPAILDIGFPLIQQFISEDLVFSADNAKAFYSAYFSNRQTTTEEKAHIFDAALFIALDYIIYGDMAKRWERVKYAIENKDRLMKTIQ